MATTISCGVMGGGGDLPRLSMNNHVFIECGVMGGGGITDDAKIRTGVGSGILVVDSWDPADNSYNVAQNKSIAVNLHANTSTIEKSVDYDDSTSFDTGTFSDTVGTAAGVELAAASPSTDFEDYVSGNLTSVSQPELWVKRSADAWDWITSTGGEAWDGRGIALTLGNSHNHITYDEAGTAIPGGVIEFDWYSDNTYPACQFGPSFNVTGSGTAMRGHSCTFTLGSTARFNRINSATSSTGLYSGALGFTPSQDTLYHGKVKFTQGASSVSCQFKFWAATGSEPVSWTWGGSDTVYYSAGAIGIHAIGTASAMHARSDNFGVTPSPEIYFTSGDWESGEISMTDIGLYSYATIDWDETTPTDTTAAVKARWRNGGTWLACTNGGQIPGIDAGEETAAGSSKDSLELRVELSTTDTSATPIVENLRFYHEPVADAALEVEVGGVGAVVSDGTLEVWG